LIFPAPRWRSAFAGGYSSFAADGIDQRTLNPGHGGLSHSLQGLAVLALRYEVSKPRCPTPPRWRGQADAPHEIYAAHGYCIRQIPANLKGWISSTLRVRQLVEKPVSMATLANALRDLLELQC